MKKILLGALVFVGMSSFAMAQDHDHHRPPVHHRSVHHHTVHHRSTHHPMHPSHPVHPAHGPNHH